MNKTFYNPQEYVRQLQSLLISDKKKIGFLFGAGTSLALKQGASDKSKVPAISELTKSIIEKLSAEKDEEGNDIKSKNKIALDQIKTELTEEKYNIEYILSNVIQKKEIIGEGTLNGLNKTEFEELETQIKKSIKEKVSVHHYKEEKDFVENLVHTDFAEWVGRADRKSPIEIFTTNYDFLFELGLEYKNIPYYDGFVGGFEPFFDALSVENSKFSLHCTKLWKIHGSLGWTFDKKREKVLRKSTEHIEDKDILVYPSILKYSEAKKFPYISLTDRLSNFLKQDDSVLFVCGYSFGDAHINEVILSALKTNTTSHVFVLFYDEYKEKIEGKDTINYALQNDSKLANIAKESKKISVYGMRNAVIGGVFGEWKLKNEPDKEDTINMNLYFDEDAAIDESATITERNTTEHPLKGNENWTGKGKFILPDFAKFVNFLTSMIINNNEELKK
ncbi:MAG: SIR2 family protein [Odoribacteraceae bacterium]|jgi:hypothetical protein|nr:SIR2 family protein [Odoribacteraceae bacterium]